MNQTTASMAHEKFNKHWLNSGGIHSTATLNDNHRGGVLLRLLLLVLVPRFLERGASALLRFVDGRRRIQSFGLSVFSIEATLA